MFSAPQVSLGLPRAFLGLGLALQFESSVHLMFCSLLETLGMWLNTAVNTALSVLYRNIYWIISGLRYILHLSLYQFLWVCHHVRWDGGYQYISAKEFVASSLVTNHAICLLVPCLSYTTVSKSHIGIHMQYFLYRAMRHCFC